LIKYETLDKGQLDQIMQGQEPDPPEGWQDSEGDVSGYAGKTGDSGDSSDRTSVGGPAEQL
jgi:cell division protease FtsH